MAKVLETHCALENISKTKPNLDLLVQVCLIRINLCGTENSCFMLEILHRNQMFIIARQKQTNNKLNENKAS